MVWYGVKNLKNETFEETIEYVEETSNEDNAENAEGIAERVLSWIMAGIAKTMQYEGYYPRAGEMGDQVKFSLRNESITLARGGNGELRHWRS